MTFDFPVEKIDIKFKTFGSCYLSFFINGIEIDVNGPVTILKDKIQDSNTINIEFLKAQPDDVHSYAELEYFKINDGDFSSWFKSHNYNINTKHHPDTKDIVNNGYFGYAGKLEIKFEDCVDPLKIAGWTIADKEFEPIKYPLKDGIYREKTFETVYRDARYAFTGSLAPNTKEINDVVNSTSIGELRKPLRMDQDRKRIEEWINQSKRITLQGLDQLPYFSYSAGILDSMQTFIFACETLFIPHKMYYYHGELLSDKDINVKDAFKDDFVEGANVIFEYPSPHYDTQEIDHRIQKAKQKNCSVALDCTWMPITTETIDLDLSNVDEIYVSMNKTWPIHDLRPAFRWSRHKVNDKQAFESDWGNYVKVPPNMFLILMEQFPYDYVYDKYRDDAQQIRTQFGLEITSVLWFTKHESAKHDPNEYINKYYFLDEFVCLRKLLDFKNKYFW